jgi:hypothetical protein
VDSDSRTTCGKQQQQLAVGGTHSSIVGCYSASLSAIIYCYSSSLSVIVVYSAIVVYKCSGIHRRPSWVCQAT